MSSSSLLQRYSRFTPWSQRPKAAALLSVVLCSASPASSADFYLVQIADTVAEIKFEHHAFFAILSPRLRLPSAGSRLSQGIDLLQFGVRMVPRVDPVQIVRVVGLTLERRVCQFILSGQRRCNRFGNTPVDTKVSKFFNEPVCTLDEPVDVDDDVCLGIRCSSLL